MRNKMDSGCKEDLKHRRIKRVQRDVQRFLSFHLRKYCQEIVTISKIDVSPDLTRVIAYVTGPDKSAVAPLTQIEGLGRMMAKSLRLRVAPRVKFEWDESSWFMFADYARNCTKR